jgi:hypothetical protein
MLDGLTEWQAVLTPYFDGALACAIGRFDRSGRAHYLNAGMRDLLGNPLPDDSLAHLFAAPAFETFLAAEPVDGETVYRGWLTLIGANNFAPVGAGHDLPAR